MDLSNNTATQMTPRYSISFNLPISCSVNWVHNFAAMPEGSVTMTSSNSADDPSLKYTAGLLLLVVFTSLAPQLVLITTPSESSFSLKFLITTLYPPVTY